MNNQERIDEVSKKYVELKNKIKDNAEGNIISNEIKKIFSAKFISSLKNILNNKCKDGNNIKISSLCSDLQIKPELEHTIKTIINFKIIPGFKIIRGRNGGIVKTEDYGDLKNKFKECQGEYIELFKFLVLSRARKYRQFPNYEDLTQDGFEALLAALNTYDPDKGSFYWWADHYIKTKISRSANAHSTIRVPLKKAKKEIPFKETELPILISTNNPQDNAEDTEIKQKILKAVDSLPEINKKIVNFSFGFNNTRELNVMDIMKLLDLTYPQYIKLFNESKILLRECLKI